MIPRPPINIRSRSQGHKVQKGDRVVGVIELCTLSSAQPLVIIVIIIIIITYAEYVGRRG